MNRRGPAECVMTDQNDRDRSVAVVEFPFKGGLIQTFKSLVKHIDLRDLPQARVIIVEQSGPIIRGFDEKLEALGTNAVTDGEVHDLMNRSAAGRGRRFLGKFVNVVSSTAPQDQILKARDDSIRPGPGVDGLNARELIAANRSPFRPTKHCIDDHCEKGRTIVQRVAAKSTVKQVVLGIVRNNDSIITVAAIQRIDPSAIGQDVAAWPALSLLSRPPAANCSDSSARACFRG